MIATASPGSSIGLYAGSGFYQPNASNPGTTQGAYSNVFTAFQGAFWDQTNQPPVISASTSMTQQTKPGSPSPLPRPNCSSTPPCATSRCLKADNDFGSSWGFPERARQPERRNSSSPYVIVVGGTSVTTQNTAPSDPTTSALYAAALANDPSTLRQLVVAGLKIMPSNVTAPQTQTFLESVWNQFDFTPCVEPERIEPGHLDRRGLRRRRWRRRHDAADALVPACLRPRADQRQSRALWRARPRRARRRRQFRGQHVVLRAALPTWSVRAGPKAPALLHRCGPR